MKFVNRVTENKLYNCKNMAGIKTVAATPYFKFKILMKAVF